MCLLRWEKEKQQQLQCCRSDNHLHHLHLLLLLQCNVGNSHCLSRLCAVHLILSSMRINDPFRSTWKEQRTGARISLLPYKIVGCRSDGLSLRTTTTPLNQNVFALVSYKQYNTQQLVVLCRRKSHKKLWNEINESSPQTNDTKFKRCIVGEGWSVEVTDLGTDALRVYVAVQGRFKWCR